MPMILESNQNHATAKNTEVINALPASMGMGGGYIPMVVEPIGADLYNQTTTGNVSKTLNSIKSDSDHVPCVIYAVDMGGGKPSAVFYEDISPTLCTTHYGEPVVTEPIVVRDEMTIKVDTNGKVFALRGRDHKSVQCVVTDDAESNRNT